MGHFIATGIKFELGFDNGYIPLEIDLVLVGQYGNFIHS
jgi:hypothetical protein